MKTMNINLGGIDLKIRIEEDSEYPAIEISENENTICLVEVNKVDKNIATISYNEKDEDFVNKTLFRYIK